ncbi:MAG TPA: universal stress protein [Acidimicrobiales bacterium]
MGKIVVGVDGSVGSRSALRWAHAEAVLRSCPLEVVLVWQFPVMTSLPAFGAVPPPEDLSGDSEASLQATLQEEGVASTDAVPVTATVAEGAAAAALIEVAKDADLLVVGSRGRGGFTGLLLGSVSQQCTMHGRCPVVVVPAE